MIKTVKVRVIPNSNKDDIFDEGERLKIRVTAPAIHGKANKAVIKVLAKFLGIKKSAINIIKGDKSRDKVLEVRR